MKKHTLLLLPLFALLLVACGNQSSSGSGSPFAKVTKSETQKKAETFMNTKSDLLKECTNLQSQYPNDKIQLSMTNWNNAPVDTVYQGDIYDLQIQKYEAYGLSKGHEHELPQLIQSIKDKPDWKEIRWIVYTFDEQVERTFSVSGETGKSKYPCVCLYNPRTGEVEYIIEKKEYNENLITRFIAYFVI